MLMDRVTKCLLAVIAAALVVIAARPWLSESRWFAFAPAGVANAETATPKFEVTVPKSWGKLINFSNNNFLLESPDGSLRIVDVEGKSPEYPKVKVLIRWQ